MPTVDLHQKMPPTGSAPCAMEVGFRSYNTWLLLWSGPSHKDLLIYDMATVTATKLVSDFTVESSTHVVRNLMMTELASIAFNRKIFPDEYFFLRNINGRDYPFIRKGADPVADAMLSWLGTRFLNVLMEGVVRKIMFCISSEDPASDPEGKSVVERYEFSIAYVKSDDEAGRFVIPCSERVVVVRPMSKGQVTDTISTIVDSSVEEMRKLRPLPKKRWLSLKVFFDDERVRETGFQPQALGFGIDYVPVSVCEVPSGFKSCNTGAIFTPHHAIKCRISLAFDLFSADDAIFMDCPTSQPQNPQPQNPQPQNPQPQNPQPLLEDAKDVKESAVDEPTKSLRAWYNQLKSKKLRNDIAQARVMMYVVSEFNRSPPYWTNNDIRRFAKVTAPKASAITRGLQDVGILVPFEVDPTKHVMFLYKQRSSGNPSFAYLRVLYDIWQLLEPLYPEESLLKTAAAVLKGAASSLHNEDL